MNIVAANFWTAINFLQLFLVSAEFLFLFTFVFFINIFNKNLTTFLRIIILLILLFIVSFYLSYLGLDFFAGFLLVFELPVMLIASIFYFHRHGVKFDSIYSYNTDTNYKNTAFIRVVYIFMFLVIIKALQPAISGGLINSTLNNSFVYNLQDHMYIGFKNDFLVWFVTLYLEQPQIVIFIGTMIFIVSFVIILIFYMLKAYNLVKKKKEEAVLVQRKQQLNRQAVFNNKLSFFSTKVSNEKTDKFLEFLSLKEKLFLEAESLLAELEPYKKIRRIKNAKGRSFWYHIDRLYKDPQDDIQLPWTELLFDIRFYGVYDEEFNDFFYEELIIIIEAREYELSNIYSFLPENILLGTVDNKMNHFILTCSVSDFINPFTL